MCDSFCHLHNHTEYSLLDGATRIKDMVSLAKEQGMPALAITDHGAMFGAMEFYLECQKQGVKPIIGMEAYVARNGHDQKTGPDDKSGHHLLLLAKNEAGYRNLCKLHTLAALRGFYYNPRVDHEMLRQHSEGLISTTTCIGSEVNQALLEGNYDKAQYIAGMYKEMFGADSYFVELQRHNMPDQDRCNKQLIQIADELDLPLIATNDAHYLCRDDAGPHEVLLCIGTGAQMTDEKRFKFPSQEFYVKSPQEMAELFHDIPSAVSNTKHVADLCELELGSDRALMPDPDLPEGRDEEQYLRELAEGGLKDRVAKLSEDYHERLNYELDVIKTTGFDAYFLLVREFAQFTRDKGIMFGVRGSAAGSLVSYALGITDVDPVAYDLTFERFLNPERVSMPDIDMDFQDDRRDEVIDWVTEKYGSDRVAQIVTFGTLGAKAALRDSARVMGFEPAEADKLCKTIPNGPGWSLGKAEKEVSEFREMVEGQEKYKQLFATAKRIEGLSRHTGVHAAGVVISKDELDNHIPLYRGSDGQAVTAYEMGILEQLGMLKMDFLGLSNLSVLARAIDNIRVTHAEILEDTLKLAEHPVLQGGHNAIPFEDDRTFEMLGRGETVGVFQLESEGMRRNILELKPISVRELAAMVALYRPGPMEHIPTYVNNKFGRSETQYLDPRMEPILEETYGVIVYQDQVLKLVQAMAGFSLGKADILRRAMGKKKLDVMEAMKSEFMDGCAANGIAESTALEVWQLLLPFAGYAFNKAHAVCYAIVAYQTAYLKANYPVEYMAALLSVYHDKEDRVVAFIEECRRHGIQVMPPDVNRPCSDFTIEYDHEVPGIRFGMEAIKGVGGGLVKAIIEDRKQEGEYTHLFEFAERVRSFGLNRTSLEALIKAGALDSIDSNRHRLLNHTEAALSFADYAKRHRESGQDSLFGGDQAEVELNYPELPPAEELNRTDKLAQEKSVLGIYVSDHPLRGFERSLSLSASHSCATLEELPSETEVRIAGVVSAFRSAVSKRGSRYAIMQVEDLTGSVTCMAFGETYNSQIAEKIEKDTVVSVRGVIKDRDQRGRGGDGETEVRILQIEPLQPIGLSSAEPDETVEGSVLLRISSATKQQLMRLRERIKRNPGNYEVMLQFAGDPLGQPVVLIERVSASQEVVAQLENTVANAKAQVVRYRDSRAMAGQAS